METPLPPPGWTLKATAASPGQRHPVEMSLRVTPSEILQKHPGHRKRKPWPGSKERWLDKAVPCRERVLMGSGSQLFLNCILELWLLRIPLCAGKPRSAWQAKPHGISTLQKSVATVTDSGLCPRDRGCGKVTFIPLYLSISSESLMSPPNERKTKQNKTCLHKEKPRRITPPSSPPGLQIPVHRPTAASWFPAPLYFPLDS